MLRRFACCLISPSRLALPLAAFVVTAVLGDDRLVRPPQTYERHRITIVRKAFTPTSAYERRAVVGFTVLVHPDTLQHPKELDEALTELQRQLENIRRVLPADKFQVLLGVRFWLEWDQKSNGAAEFHLSPAWLADHGYNPDKWRDVEICNIRNFVSWSRSAQPWMLMHELAHAYHHRVLGSHHGGVYAAYKQAMERKLYESVPYVLGGKRKAYAATNQDEYFAEISEAYFGKNDFYPFDRADLEKHDPVGFRLVEEVWGVGWRCRPPEMLTLRPRPM